MSAIDAPFPVGRSGLKTATGSESASGAGSYTVELDPCSFWPSMEDTGANAWIRSMVDAGLGGDPDTPRYQLGVYAGGEGYSAAWRYIDS